MNENKIIDLSEELFNDLIPFSTEWLNVEDYEFKLLVLTSVLAENNLAYRGTLKAISEWLGISPCAKNNAKIKEAINSLCEKGYLFYKLDGRTWTLTISEKGMKDKQIVNVRKIWVNVIKEFKSDYYKVSWIKVLKVFIYVYSIKEGTLIKTDNIATDLGISKSTVSTALRALENINFPKLVFCRNKIKDTIVYDNKTIKPIKGCEYIFIMMFE